MKTQNFGDISVTKVLDGTEKFKAALAFPGVQLDHFHQHLDFQNSLDMICETTHISFLLYQN